AVQLYMSGLNDRSIGVNQLSLVVKSAQRIPSPRPEELYAMRTQRARCRTPVHQCARRQPEPDAIAIQYSLALVTQARLICQAISTPSSSHHLIKTSAFHLEIRLHGRTSLSVSGLYHAFLLLT